jgi:hypothetical protein
MGAIVDTGKVDLVSDIKSFSQNDSLVAIPPNGKMTEYLSRKKILGKYPAYGIKKLLFYLVYYKQPDFRSESEIIRLPGI